MSSENSYKVLLYYKFTEVPDVPGTVEAQQEICETLNLRGRILIAKEGINGTVSGLAADADRYMEYMKAHPVFRGIEFKVDPYHEHTFLKLHVREKEEIVHFGVDGIHPVKPSINYIEPEEFRDILKKSEEDEDIVILDARSKYETDVGKFKNALTLDIDNFRDLPDAVKELDHLKDKKIYTYCTGGIKCEKVAMYLEEAGFEQVRQLHGGIIRYGHEMKGEDFEGSCYVFDQRVVVPVNEVNPVVIGKCDICEENRTERMINCANPECNKHFLICEACAETMEGCCSETCMKHPRRRVFDGKGYYLRGVNSKNYVFAD